MASSLRRYETVIRKEPLDTMREIGIEFPAKGQMSFCELGVPPAPEAGQLLLETLYSGITNGTERHGLMAEHGYSGFPGRHGYQHVCRVVRCGSEVGDWFPGDVVFYGDYVGHRAWHLVDVSGGTPLMAKLPGDADYGHCALLGVAGVALRAVRRLRVGVGQKVWVVGLGPIGIFAAQCARALGAHVSVADIVASRLDVAGRTGAQRAVNMSRDDAWERVEAEAPYDVIVDCAGYERLFLDVFEHGLLARGGAVGAIAVRAQACFPWSLLHTTEASIEVSCHFSVAELECLLEWTRTGAVQIEPMVSHSVGIEEAPAIYATMRDDPRALYGVVFDWR